MAYVKRTNIFHSILFSRGMALAILFVIVFVGYGLVSIIGKSLDASRDRKSSEAQAEALKAKNDDMARKLAMLDTEDGKEAALREQFPVVKEGEHVVVITDAVPEKGIDAHLKEDSSEGGGFWNFLKNLFKKE